MVVFLLLDFQLVPRAHRNHQPSPVQKDDLSEPTNSAGNSPHLCQHLHRELFGRMLPVHRIGIPNGQVKDDEILLVLAMEDDQPCQVSFRERTIKNEEALAVLHVPDRQSERASPRGDLGLAKLLDGALYARTDMTLPGVEVE